ncbi:DUF4270 family protein [Chryseobacterium sp. SC28]|uniref:DUF4270 family protein n=1 Tax=Chryseobacterium sp. SC28 TaxID=2268028 RepID=UPI000F646C26|nr:DUF4270 family protein [Chryseobacterium sp. SC28]RRQ45229.1 DUF4270 family protein [Chryseobacterium sp. SC28]
MYKYLLLCVASVLLFSCERESNTYEVGNTWVSAQSEVVLIDTLTMRMSTIMKDSVITSGESSILVGNIKDHTFGKVNSTSMFELTPESYSLATTSNVVFDSIVMYLTNINFYYGDTLQTFKMEVHPLIDRLKLNSDGYLYNNSDFDYSSNTVGSKEFLPRPKTDSSFVTIKLENSYGLEIFNLLKSKDVTSQEYFLNFYKGLALVASSDNNAMLRFGINSSYKVQIDNVTKEKASNLVRIYYHTASVNGTEEVKYTLDLNPSATYQYNKIKSDFTGSDLAGLSPSNPLESKNLGNRNYMMSGIGVFTKVEFPYLKSIKNLYSNYKIISAELSLSPVAGYYSKIFYNPTTLYYYLGDKKNNIVSAFLQADGVTEITSTLSDNSEFQTNYGYTFSFLSYVNSILYETATSNNAVLIYPSSYGDALPAKTVVGDQKNPTNPAKFNLYLVGY